MSILVINVTHMRCNSDTYPCRATPAHILCCATPPHSASLTCSYVVQGLRHVVHPLHIHMLCKARSYLKDEGNCGVWCTYLYFVQVRHICISCTTQTHDHCIAQLRNIFTCRAPLACIHMLCGSTINLPTWTHIPISVPIRHIFIFVFVQFVHKLLCCATLAHTSTPAHIHIWTTMFTTLPTCCAPGLARCVLTCTRTKRASLTY